MRRFSRLVSVLFWLCIGVIAVSVYPIRSHASPIYPTSYQKKCGSSTDACDPTFVRCKRNVTESGSCPSSESACRVWCNSYNSEAFGLESDNIFYSSEEGCRCGSGANYHICSAIDVSFDEPFVMLESCCQEVGDDDSCASLCSEFRAQLDDDSFCPAIDCVDGQYYAYSGCGTCVENNPANSHQVYLGEDYDDKYNCPWVCDEGYYGSSESGDDECTVCGFGYHCPGDGTRVACGGIPAHSHLTGDVCSWECDAGYYGSSANGNTSCSACGSGYFCTGGTNKTACSSIVKSGSPTPSNYISLSPTLGWGDQTHATSREDCWCDWYLEDETKTYLNESRCMDGPLEPNYTHYYDCKTGYYATNPLNRGDWYQACEPCNNGPEDPDSFEYTSYSTPSTMYAVESNCPWECKPGYTGDDCHPIPVYTVTLDNQGADTAGTTEFYYQYQFHNPCYYYTSPTTFISSTCMGGNGYTITVPTRTGYTFGGYYTGRNGAGTQYVNASGTCVNNIYSAVANDITLYAKWTPKSYTCSSGRYLPANSTSCSTCEAGSYCTGGTFSFGSGDKGLSDCPGDYPYSDAGATKITQCYSDTQQRDWTGDQVNGSIPTNCESVTEWNSCSKAACDYVAYSNAYGTGDGNIKSGCSTNNSDCTMTPKTVTAEVGSYVNGATCKTCSSFSGTYTESDGGNISKNYCYTTKTKTGSQVDGSIPTNCENVTAWNSCSPGTCEYKDYYNATDTTCTPTNCIKDPKTVTAKSGYRVDGVTCPACPTNYPNSNNGNTGGINACWLSTQPGKYVETIGGGQTTCEEGNYCPGGTTIYYGGSVSGHSTTGGITECPSSYPDSDTGVMAVSSCYALKTPTCNQKDGTVPANCASVTAWNSCSCSTTKYRQYSDSTGTGDGTTSGTVSYECTKTPKTVTAKSGYRVDGTSCTACPNSYPNSANGNTGEINACYLSTTAGKYVATPSAGQTTCACGGYCPGGTTVYYGGTGTTTGGRKVCANGYYSSGGVSSCTAVPLGYSATSNKCSISANQFNVSLDANGGLIDGNVTDKTCTYGTTCNLPSVSKTGYSFTGWDCSGA